VSVLLLLLLLLLLLRDLCLRRPLDLTSACLPLAACLMLSLKGGNKTVWGCSPGGATKCCASASRNLQLTSGCLYCSFRSSKYLRCACCSMLVLTSVSVSDVMLLYLKCGRLRPVPADSSRTSPWST
jgi:hypothetical protein